MQSMFRLPWSTESPGDKIMEKAALHKSRLPPVMEMPAFMSKIKRKRTDSPEPAMPHHAHVVKKWKDASGQVKPIMLANLNASQLRVVDGVAVETLKPLEFREAAPEVAPAHVLDARPKAQLPEKEGPRKSKILEAPTLAVSSEPSPIDTPTPAMSSQLAPAIEAQINYEILLKHNELRLIEQELAKCQVSLEQLRRCSLIPFPGTEGPSQNVSAGIGAPLQPPPGFSEPQHAAPWGVVDGPYTRHYAKWLIPDAQFDSISERVLPQQTQCYFGVGEGRTTRGIFAELGSTGKARTSRTSTGTLKPQGLGENPALAPKIDPLLHKRSTDKQWVRLYCEPCGHSNFSNTQGFLNHCRIKHNQVFKSHDQAAIACGVPVDITELRNTVTVSESIATPAVTPATTFPITSTLGLVHPLIRANPVELAKDVHRDFNKPRDETKSTGSAAKSNFSQSPSTPHLSALLLKHGFEGDLRSMVDAARTTIDVDAIDSSDDDPVENDLQTTASAEPTQLVRLPVATSNVMPPNKASSARIDGKKSQPNGHPHLPLSFPTSVMRGNDGHMLESPVDLSPNTVESNPGLVSDYDDEDDEDGDDMHSQPDIIIMDDDIVVEDASDVEGVHERTGSRQGLDDCFDKGEGSCKH